MRGGSEVHTQSDDSGSVPIVRHDRAPLRRGQMARGHAGDPVATGPPELTPKAEGAPRGVGSTSLWFLFPISELSLPARAVTMSHYVCPAQFEL